MTKRNTCVCPICKGSGFVEEPYGRDVDVLEVKKEMAVKLRNKGFSLRQIQRALGYKSVRSIVELIKK